MFQKIVNHPILKAIEIDKSINLFIWFKKNQHSFIYKNGLSIVFILLTVTTLVGQAITGCLENNKDRAEKHVEPLNFRQYLLSPHFIEAIFENWESEFLQMALYVILTVKLRQIGSSESKKIDGKENVDREPKAHKDAPWSVKKGGSLLAIYKNSLTIAFIILFLASFALHVKGSLESYNLNQQLQGKPLETLGNFLVDSKLWFESFQNW